MAKELGPRKIRGMSFGLHRLDADHAETGSLFHAVTQLGGVVRLVACFELASGLIRPVPGTGTFPSTGR